MKIDIHSFITKDYQAGNVDTDEFRSGVYLLSLLGYNYNNSKPSESLNLEKYLLISRLHSKESLKTILRSGISFVNEENVSSEILSKFGFKQTRSPKEYKKNIEGCLLFLRDAQFPIPLGLTVLLLNNRKDPSFQRSIEIIKDYDNYKDNILLQFEKDLYSHEIIKMAVAVKEFAWLNLFLKDPEFKKFARNEIDNKKLNAAMFGQLKSQNILVNLIDRVSINKVISIGKKIGSISNINDDGDNIYHLFFKKLNEDIVLIKDNIRWGCNEFSLIDFNKIKKDLLEKNKAGLTPIDYCAQADLNWQKNAVVDKYKLQEINKTLSRLGVIEEIAQINNPNINKSHKI